MMPPLLAGVDVGHVQLDKGDGHAEEGVADRHRRVRPAARVNDDAVGAVGAGLLDAVDAGALPVPVAEIRVRLPSRHCVVVLAFFLDIIKRVLLWKERNQGQTIVVSVNSRLEKDDFSIEILALLDPGIFHVL